MLEDFESMNLEHTEVGPDMPFDPASPHAFAAQCSIDPEAEAAGFATGYGDEGMDM